MRCTNGQHIGTYLGEKNCPCDFAILATRDLPGPNGRISLIRHFGNYDVEAILNRERNGKPWYPTLDEEWFTEDDTEEEEARAVFETMYLKWKDATPALADAEAI